MTTAIRQTGLLVQWQLRRSTDQIPLLIVVQLALAVATVIGYGFLVGDIEPGPALFLATGAPTITLVMVGFVMTPQVQAQAKTEGSAAWLKTLPTPRMSFLVADLVVWTLIALPGMVLSILVGAWRYDLQLSITPWVVGVAILVSLTAAAFGYALACVLKPQVAMLMSQLLVFIVLLFSPVSFPASRMPEWLQTVHEFLPFQPMANLVRSGLANDAFPLEVRDLVVLGLWCGLSLVTASVALRKRD